MNSMRGYFIKLLRAAVNSKLSSSSRICMNGRSMHFFSPSSTRNLEISHTTKCVGERGLVPRSLW